MAIVAKDLPSILLDYFRCDPSTGLVYRIKDSGNAKAGQVVKFKRCRTSGQMALKFCGRQYTAHRVVWFLCKREQPPTILDHRDCDPTNNRLDNLRPATSQQNGANKRGMRDIPKGVRPTANGRFRCVITIDYRAHDLGSFDTVEEASRAYMAMATTHFGEFARAK